MLFERAAVIGVGLIGGSLAAASRRIGSIAEVVGVGRTQANLDTALENDLVDRVTTNISEIGDVDLVVLAVPVRSTGNVVESLAPHLREGTVVTDVGSVKESVVIEASAALPPGCHFVGAHPIAGSEQTGAAAARADLFRGQLCVVTPSSSVPSKITESVAELWRLTGARVVQMPPAEHDRALAWTSHVVHVVAYALAASLDEGGDGVLDFAGPGLVDATRMAGGSVPMWRDIFIANRSAVLASLDGFSGVLAELRAAIDAGDDDRVDALLQRGLDIRRKLERKR